MDDLLFTILAKIMLHFLVGSCDFVVTSMIWYRTKLKCFLLSKNVVHGILDKKGVSLFLGVIMDRMI
jgi:hypothetical protein